MIVAEASSLSAVVAHSEQNQYQNTVFFTPAYNIWFEIHLADLEI